MNDEVTSTPMTHSPQTLRESVKTALTHYFQRLEDASVTNLYHLVMEEVEAPLFEVVMQHTKNNQSLAARLLGLSRGTLGKKLQKYGIE